MLKEEPTFKEKGKRWENVEYFIKVRFSLLQCGFSLLALKTLDKYYREKYHMIQEVPLRMLRRKDYEPDLQNSDCRFSTDEFDRDSYKGRFNKRNFYCRRDYCVIWDTLY